MVRSDRINKKNNANNMFLWWFQNTSFDLLQVENGTSSNRFCKEKVYNIEFCSFDAIRNSRNKLLFCNKLFQVLFNSSAFIKNYSFSLLINKFLIFFSLQIFSIPSHSSLEPSVICFQIIILE